MPEVGSAWVTIVPSFRGGATALTRQLSRETSRASARAGQESGRGWGRSFSSSAMVGVQAFSSGTAGAFAGVSARLRGLAGLATTAGLAFGAAGIAGGTMGLKTAASLQQAQIAFETLLGSGEKARSFLGDLTEFAETTPFQLPGLIDASRQLIGVGQSAKSVIPTLTAWGDTAGALGLGQEQFSRAMLAVTQAMSKGKVQAEELMQITEAGIPIWPLMARAMGKTVPELQEMSSSGELLAKDVFPKLEKQMNREYGGAMAKQSKTLAGLWSTLMDTLEIGLADAIQPLIPTLQKAMPKAIAALSSGLKAAGGVIAGIFRTLKPLADALGPVIRDALAGLGPVFTAAAKGAGVFFDAVSGNKTTAADTGPLRLLADVGEAIHDAFQAAAPVVAKFGEALQKGLGDAGTRLAPALRGAVSAVRGLVASVWPQIQRFATQLAAALGPALRQIVGILAGQVIPAISRFITALRPVAQFLIGILGPAVIGVFQGGVQIIKGGLQILAGLFNIITAILTGDWRAAWNGILQIGRGIWQAIQGAFQAFVNGGILKIFRVGLGLLAKLARNAWNGIKGLFTQGMNAARGVVDSGIGAVVGFFTALPGRLVSALRSLAAQVGRMFTGAMNAAQNAVTTGIGWLALQFLLLPGRILAALGDLGRLLFNAGRNLLTGLWNGIKSVAGQLLDWMRGLADQVRGLWPFSPAKWGPLRSHPMDTAGANLVRLLAQGIQTETPRLLAQLEQLAGHAASAASPVVEPRFDTRAWTRRATNAVSTPAAAAAMPGAGGDTINVYAHAVDLDERRLARVLYAARLRQRVGRPR